MQVLTIVEDALAFIKLPKGVYKQVPMYKRDNLLYVPHGGGYVQIRGKEHNGTYATSNPNVTVVEFECRRVSHEPVLGSQHPRYESFK